MIVSHTLWHNHTHTNHTNIFAIPTRKKWITNFIAASSPGPPSYENGAHDTEKLLLKTQVSEDFAEWSESNNVIYYSVKSKTIILPVVLYRCEAWSLTLREEWRLRVFENRILRKRFEPKRDANREWRRLHSKELHSLYCLPNIARMIKSRMLSWADHLARTIGILQKF